MEMYLLKFSACLFIFWLVYVLLLEKLQMHHFKRFYLLGSFVIALVIPQLTIIEYVEPIVQNFETSPMYIPIESTLTEVQLDEKPVITAENILWLVYGIGVLLFAIRFAYNLTNLYRRISRNEKISNRSFIYVLLKDYRIPHSFFKYIFLNKSKFENNDIPKEVLLHEETHAKQWHSLDILLLELLQVVFWFHPLVYILKHHIKLNHEFLADDAVLQQGIAAKNYQNILLQFSSSTQDFQFMSAINYSSIKKRFTVMKTQTSKTRMWLSTLVLLPIIAILFFSFAEREYIEKEPIENSGLLQLEKNSQSKGATKAMMQEYNDWIKQLNNNSSNLFIPVGTWERLAAIYDIMNEEQRSSVETHPFLQETIMPNLFSTKPSKPTSAQFESWKNEKEFAIWLDGKHISNSTLNKYSVNDIVHFEGSKVHKNAQSEKFPQRFQFSLYTKDGFNKFYTEAYINDYRALTKTYSNAISEYLKGDQTDNSELRIIKAQADKIYNQFTKEDLDKYNILPTPPIPAQKQQDIPTQEEVEAYNVWAKKIKKETLRAQENERNGKTAEYPIIKQKDLVKYVSIYKRMTEEQKQNSVKLPIADEELKNTELKFPPPPPKTQQQKASVIQITQYNVWAKKMNAALKKAEATNTKIKEHPIITQKEYDKYYKIYNNLMTQAQRENAEPWPNIPPSPPPPPPAPEIPKVRKGGEDIPPPPPPTKGENDNLNRNEPNELTVVGYSLNKNNEQKEIVVKGYPSPKKVEEAKNLEPITVVGYPKPPKPESPMDLVIRMAKADAKFFNEGKSISSDEAIALIKENDNLNINAKEKSKDGKPSVYITKKPIIIKEND